MSVILVVNTGSSSIKYQIIEMEGEQVLAKGLVERIGTDSGVVTHSGPNGKHRKEHPVLDHVAGFGAMVDACNTWDPKLDEVPIVAVGHRVVQGGARFVAPTIINDAVIRAIEEISPLAPLHNPPNLLGIRAARKTFPDIPHVAVFDTAFHQTMPEEAYTYAIDTNIAHQYRIRRYGFHGTSHKYVSQQAAEHLGIPYGEFNAVVLHIGNGVSACAVRNGESIDTSMGMTPLEGLVMGTRSGDIDPGILFHLHRKAGMTPDQLDDLLNHRSGLLGMTGTSDVRDLLASVKRGDARAQLALDVYCYRLKSYIGAYVAQLGRVDAIIFTAGVGENAAEVRRKAIDGLAHIGVVLDECRNAERADSIHRISTDDSPTCVLVVPTNEEVEIARQTEQAISR